MQAEEKKKFELKAQIVQYLHCKMELEKAKQLEEALKEEVRIWIMIEHVSAGNQSFGEGCED